MFWKLCDIFDFSKMCVCFFFFKNGESKNIKYIYIFVNTLLFQNETPFNISPCELLSI